MYSIYLEVYYNYITIKYIINNRSVNIWNSLYNEMITFVSILSFKNYKTTFFYP